MKRRYLSALAVVLSVPMLLGSCSEKAEPVTAVTGTFKIEIEAYKGGTSTPFTKALGLSEDELTLSATFNNGEEVYVYQVNPNSSPYYGFVGTLRSVYPDGSSNTILEGSLTGTFKKGDQLLFSYLHEIDFDFTGQKGTLDDIAKRFDYAVTGADIQDVSGDRIWCGNMYLSSQQWVVKFILKDEDGNPVKPNRLVIDTINDNDNYTEYPQFTRKFHPLGVDDPSNIDMSSIINYGEIDVAPSGDTNEIFVALTGNANGNAIMAPLINGHIRLTATVGNDVYTYDKQGVNFYNNGYYVVDVTMTKK